jgi:sensor histidine kinase YesM
MKKLLFTFVSAFLFNTAIAAVLNLFMAPFWHQFVYSQCIGFSVLIINMGVAHFVKNPLRRVAVLSISLPGSVAFGLTLAFAFTGTGSWGGEYMVKTMALGLFFGLIGVITYLLSERIGMEVEQRKLLKSESERREVEANLKLLQAQIEPHFLFNTLANVGSLIDGDPALAKKLLERLNDWLRVALARARSDRTTLDDELSMLENYLQILKIRFGERLHWRIEAGDTARLMPFPPMLLQPLVENAVRHGIEPKIGGGEIGICVSIENASLRISVSDSGVGLVDTDDNGGAGLANVRARLKTLFGETGQLCLQSREQGGTVATLELPATR